MQPDVKTAWLSILTNVLLVMIKALLAAATGSLAIKADAVHSLTDVLSSFAILLGIKISKRRTRAFPYGLYKLENLVALGTSLLIFLAGYEIIKDVFANASPLVAGQMPLAVGGIALTIIITWLFSRYELKKGEETGSPSLVADARHIWTDMLSSLVILLSLLGNMIGFALDRYAALIVVAFIGRTALLIALDAVRVLLDASLDPESLESIRRIVTNDPHVVTINQLRARNAGRYKFVELDLTLRVKELEKGHRISEEIKRSIKAELQHVDHVQIHYEPQQKDHFIVAMPLSADRRTLSEHFGEAPFFRMVTLLARTGDVTLDAVTANPFCDEEKAKGIKVANWLLTQGVDSLLVREQLAGKGPGYVLGNAEVTIEVTRQSDAEVALSNLRESGSQES
ncbi:cation diffusion facilitator family transporter [Malonomonas rubra DSM 5091]|uniref:Cation diffusion facilitator family transporter n=1 Tax=Malonomonas rubra DSM 5091 TaxID=1122189 RepID=A0A1M6I4X9_MALRU|nr:cation diffusion facilitator family transporter [Malonomonas rubra]SHJ29489.1 cation diffusion facilitator family transporter [Malonomonas rubra DSM 5091]